MYTLLLALQDTAGSYFVSYVAEPEDATAIFGIIFFIFMIIFFMLMMALFIALLIFWIFMLIDCVKREFPDPNTKTIWVLLLGSVRKIPSVPNRRKIPLRTPTSRADGPASPCSAGVRREILFSILNMERLFGQSLALTGALGALIYFCVGRQQSRLPHMAHVSEKA